MLVTIHPNRRKGKKPRHVTLTTIVSSKKTKQTAVEKSLPKNIEPNSDDTMANEEELSSNPSTSGNENNENVLSYEQLTQMVGSMSAALGVAMNHLKSACETIHSYRTKSTLGVSDTKVAEADLPLLTLFEQYNLPLQTKEEVDKLEAELESSNDFLKFFVGSNLY